MPRELARRDRRAGRHRVLLPAGDRGAGRGRARRRRLITARPGRSSSNSAPILSRKERYVAPLAAKGAVFLDGEVSGTPGMVAARKGDIYLAGDQRGAKVEPSRTPSPTLPLSRPVRRRHHGQAHQQLSGRLHIAGTAKRWPSGSRGRRCRLMIKAIATGAAAPPFAIRAPWMAQRKFLPRRARRRGSALSRAARSSPTRWRATPCSTRRRDLPTVHRLGIERAATSPRHRCKRRRRREKARKLRKIGRGADMIRVTKIAHAIYETPDLVQADGILHRHPWSDT